MAQTRLRGLEIAGIQIGLEVPETCEWEWPDGPIADYACLPRDPEVHVGIRVGDTGREDLGGERYGLGAWTFEVARQGEDWLLGLSRRGVREQLACFDRDFRAGEIVFSRETSIRPGFPLRGPLDEWIVLHRTVARGGLCLNASAAESGGRAGIRLGAPERRAPDRWISPSTTLFGGQTLLVRPEAGSLRVFRTPWGEAMDGQLASGARVGEIAVFEEADRAFREWLDPEEAAELLVTHAVVPLCDEGLLDRVLGNAQRIAASDRVYRIGAVADPEAPMAWQSPQLHNAFAPPRAGL